MAPRNIEYDTKGKVYVRGSWLRPLFEFPAERVLTWLSQGYGDGEPIQWKGTVAHEGASLPGKIDLEILSVLTRAIHQGAAVEATYRALSSGLTTREIVPFALADSGLRWHVRAFDRRSREFRDFVLGRLDDARIVPGAVADREKPDQDIQWNRITELELVPHPANVQHPDTIEAEYGMESGVLKVRARAAMAGYLLRRGNVDCTEDHSLNVERLTELEQRYADAQRGAAIVVDVGPRLAQLEQEIGNITDAIVKGLVSDALASRLKAAEAERGRLLAMRERPASEPRRISAATIERRVEMMKRWLRQGGDIARSAPGDFPRPHSPAARRFRAPSLGSLRGWGRGGSVRSAARRVPYSSR